VKKAAAFSIAYLAVMALLVFQPASNRAVYAQSGDATPDPYIDALSTQVALNTQATLAAYQQQQAASDAQAQAAQAQAQAQAALAAAAQAQAAAAAQAQQATIAAGQQQAALISAQSTADAAALLATAQVQQTRTAIEIQTTATAVSAGVRATATGQALQARSTQAAIDATRTMSADQADAQRRDNQAIATSVAMNLRATQTALDAQVVSDDKRRDTESGLQIALLFGGLVIIAVGVIVSIWLIIAVARSTRSNITSGPEVIIIDLEHERRMAAYRKLWQMQRAMLDPRRALPQGQVIDQS